MECGWTAHVGRLVWEDDRQWSTFWQLKQMYCGRASHPATTAPPNAFDDDHVFRHLTLPSWSSQRLSVSAPSDCSPRRRRPVISFSPVDRVMHLQRRIPALHSRSLSIALRPEWIVAMVWTYIGGAGCTSTLLFQGPSQTFPDAITSCSLYIFSNTTCITLVHIAYFSGCFPSCMHFCIYSTSHWPF
jgi:hypothetical protein